jgi:hypothetical protein
MERIPAQPQTPHDGQIPGRAITFPTTLNARLYKDCECRNTEISDRVEKIPLSTLITTEMIRNMQKRGQICFTFEHHCHVIELKINKVLSFEKIPVWVRFSAPVQTGPGAHPASCTMGTWSFSGVKRSGRGADHPSPSSAEVTKG